MNPMMHNYESLLQRSWYDSSWIPILNQHNVMEYFTDSRNPFYDRQSNNELLKMQRLSPEQLANTTGYEYVLIHAQEPILYVVRYQQRHSSTQVTPLADYYIVAGVIYQAPDLSSVINSRLLNATNSLESAFQEAMSYSRYHPSKGYWWEFKDATQTEKLMTKENKKKKEEPSSLFQRQRVDQLLADLAQKFPPKALPAQPLPVEKKEEQVKTENKSEVKTERGETSRPPADKDTKPPPEKKQKVSR